MSKNSLAGWVLPVLALSLLGSTGCYERPEALESELAGEASFALGERVLYLRTNPAEAVLLDFAGLTPQRYEWPLDCDLGPSTQHGEDWVAFTCWGDGAVLHVLRFETGEAPGWATYELPSAYTSLTASEDGRFVLAYFGPGEASGTLFQNASEFSVVDLSAEPGESNPTKKIVDLRDQDPLGIVITPRFEAATAAGGEGAMLALVISASQLVAFNLSDLADDELVIPLVPSGTLGDVIPAQFRFLERPDGRLDCFLTASNASDIYQVMFREDPAGVGNSAPDLHASINLLTLSRTPSDFQPFLDEDLRVRVVALNTSTQEAIIFTPDQGSQRVTHMPYPYSRVIPVPRSDGEVHFLLYRPNSGSSWSALVADLDIREADAKSADTFTLIELGEAVSEILAVEGSSTYLVRHPSASLTLMDGETHERSLIKGLGDLLDARLVGARFHLLTRSGGQTLYGVFDVETRTPRTAVVPDGAVGILSATEAGSGMLLLSYSNGGGLVSVDMGEEPPQVTEWRGFFLDGEL